VLDVEQQENMIKHVIWDFDGTLFDTYPAIVHSFVTVLQAEFHLDYDPEVIRELVRIDTKSCAAHIAREHEISSDAILARTRKFYDAQDAVPEKPYVCAREVCEEIAQRGANALVTHRDKTSTVEMLTRFNMLALFAIIITADDGFAPKPSPDSFRQALEIASLPKHETLGVGDRDLDIEAAIGAGIHSAFFSPEGEVHPKAEFSIRTLAEIREL